VQQLSTIRNWTDLRYFVAVVSEGSLAKAAKALGVEASTAQRRLASLESDLGVQLFRRTPQGYRVTPQSERLLPLAERVAATVSELQDAARGEGHAARRGDQ